MRILNACGAAVMSLLTRAYRLNASHRLCSTVVKFAAKQAYRIARTGSVSEQGSFRELDASLSTIGPPL